MPPTPSERTRQNLSATISPTTAMRGHLTKSAKPSLLRHTHLGEIEFNVSSIVHFRLPLRPATQLVTWTMFDPPHLPETVEVEVAPMLARQVHPDQQAK